MKRESWLPAAPQSAAEARAMVREAAAEQRLGASATWDLMLATTEAVANAVLHGTACAQRNGILVRIETAHHGVFVEVLDCGRFEGHTGPPPEHGLSGRGVSIMHAVMDRVEVVPDEHHTRVRMAKRDESAAA